MSREVHTACGGDGCSETLVVTGNDAGLDGIDLSGLSCDPGNNCAGKS